MGRGNHFHRPDLVFLGPIRQSGNHTRGSYTDRLYAHQLHTS